MDDFDQRVRLAAFAFLDALQRAPGGDLLSRDALIRGFEFEGRRVPLVSPQQGIFKPAILPSIPLSILTAPVVEGRERPYDDAVGRDGLLEYRYRGTDINHRDNAGLRAAMEHQTPLVYFMGIVPGKYVAASSTTPPSMPTSWACGRTTSLRFGKTFCAKSTDLC